MIYLPLIKSQDTTSHFKTNVLLKSIIGKDLINNDNIAVIELVKNSIDAESPKVLIEFKNLKNNNDEFINNKIGSDISKTSKIIISDFGKGMDEEDIEAKWLNIAYSEKKNAKRKNGLYFAGAKGVGRFSCDRLGEYLDLYSKKKNKPIRHLHIRWKDFEVENEVYLEIQDINILHEEVSDEDFYDRTGIKSFKQGTIVEISKLRGKWVKYQPRKKSWDLENLVKLKRYLEKLINPYQNTTANPYTLHILAEEFLDEEKLFHEHEKINGIIENKIFDKLDFKTTSIESQISEDGEEITTILKDKGRIIFRLREKNIKYPLLKNIKIVLFFVNQYAKIYFKKQTGTRSVKFGSIHLFINGFRVSPFGDEGNDWLGLELRKGQGYARFLGTRDLLGRVEITDTGNNYQIISSREGVVNNAEFSDLKEGSGSYFYEVLKKLERYVVEGLNWDRVSRKNQNEDDEFGELTNKEVKKFIKNYEINVMDKDWQLNTEDEIYGETQEEKDLRNIELLYSLLNVKPENILELYINEDLIKVLAAENEEKAKRIFQDLNKINPELINGNTKKVIKEINLLFEVKERELNEKSEKIKEDLLNRQKLTEQLKQAKIEKFRAEQKVKTEKKARKIAEKTVEIERNIKEKAQADVETAHVKIHTLETQNIFLKNSKDQSKDQLISFLHKIGIHSQTLTNHTRSILKDFDENKVDPETILNKLQKINFINNQIYTITNIGSKGGITNERKRDLDIVNFIYEYLMNISLPYTKGIIIHVFEKPDFQFIKSFDTFKFSYVIENFISNSLKANANNIYFSVELVKGKLMIYIEDDGEGIPSYVTDITSIFEPGIRYSKFRGTGLGLYDSKLILDKMGGDITVERKKPTGIKFMMVIQNEAAI